MYSDQHWCDDFGGSYMLSCTVCLLREEWLLTHGLRDKKRLSIELGQLHNLQNESLVIGGSILENLSQIKLTERIVFEFVSNCDMLVEQLSSCGEQNELLIPGSAHEDKEAEANAI